MEGNRPPFNPSPWDPPPPPPPNFDWVPAPFSGDGRHHHHQQFPDFHPFNPPPDHLGHNPPFFRKRKFVTDNGNFAKLYVGVVPRYVTQEEVRHLFEEHGNVVEVVLLTDKKTGQQQEYCFVKYGSVEEAEKAIAALHNQFTFPGAMTPLRVKYADGERQRLGLDHFAQQDSSLPRSGMVQHDSTFSKPAIGEAEHKVYVSGLNKEASKEEIIEIFSSYGDVADLYIMRDDLKRSRGCGFVGFSQRFMAVAAINGLNGTYVMRGCDKPLIVRIADPKKPKNGEFRPASNLADMRRNNLSNAHLGNPSSTILNPPGIQAGMFCPVANQLQGPSSNEMQQPPPEKSISPSRFSQMSLQQSETLQASSESSRQMDSRPQTPMDTNRSSNGQQHDHQSPRSWRDTESNSAMLSTGTASCALSEIDLSGSCVDCDWSEHICPDGYKYYFNCMTSESRWEKPEKFALYEQVLQRQQLQNRSNKEPPTISTSEAPSSDRQIDSSQNQGKSCDSEKPQLPVSCAVEHGHEQVQLETSPVYSLVNL